MKKSRFFVIVLLAAAIAAAVWLGSSRPMQAEPSAELLKASEGLDEISISAKLNARERSVSVTQRLKLINRTGQVQDAAVLRTWPNAFQSMDTSPCAAEDSWFERYYPGGFSSGALVMAHAEANGQSVLYRYTDEAKTVLRIPVPGGWKAGETAELELTYTLQMPQMAYRFGVWEDIWALGNSFAIPAVWEDGAFRTDAYAPVGDPFVSDCANYTVTVTVPKGYVCAGSAYPSSETANGQTVYSFEGPAMRDFALVIGSGFQTAQAMQDGVLVTAYAADLAQAREMLQYGRKALQTYSDSFGRYPYPSYTLAQAGFPNGGMEYPGLSMISADLLSAGGRELEYAVAHETAHQWWYAAVGSDGWYQPWQDEALAEFSLLIYAQKHYGYSERNHLEQSRMESAMRVTVPQGVTPGAPLSYFPSMSLYRLVVYDRGAACLCALDRTAPLDGFLRDYYQQYAFCRASREDFEQQLFVSTGEDLTPLLRDYLDISILN